jgi:pyridoxal phosphate enzyme (YggS family)
MGVEEATPGGPSLLQSRILGNLSVVRQRIGDAARASGRAPEAVRLVAVTKYVDARLTRALLEAGCRDFGESRPQDLWRKAEELNDLTPAWHFIGHLQRNKIARTLPLVSWLHSADSLRLIEALDSPGGQTGVPLRILLEVNISGDATKHGFAPDEVEPLGEQLAQFKNLDLRGLMGMASREGDLSAARREFAALRALRDRLRTAWGGRFTLDELSMGMSGDYEVAIEEGATMVRVGSALVEGLENV